MKKRMISQLLLLFLFATMVGCSDGGGGDGGGDGGGVGVAELPPGALVGTYDLIGFEVIFDDGMVFTQNDFQTFSGTMIIYSDGTFTQLVQIEGIAASVTATWEIVGSCFLVETIDPPNSCGPYCAGITFDDPFLTTVADHICGTDAVETDYWVRIGSAPANWIPDAESVALSGIEDCSNHTDDDGDGFADCEDPDCFGDADCIAARRIAPEGAGTVLGVPEDTAGRAFGMMIQGLLDR